MHEIILSVIVVYVRYEIKSLIPLGDSVTVKKTKKSIASTLRLSHPVEKAHCTYEFVLASTFGMVPYI